MGSLSMEWSATSATRAYLDTLKLCSDQKRRRESWGTQEPGSNEFVAALAAGMKAKLIVEVTSTASPSTLALASAAKQTGGYLICILPEPDLAESKKVIKDSGLKHLVEFKTGDPLELLPRYENIDFSLVDCKSHDYKKLLNLIDVNPRRSMIVANNLGGEKKGLGGHLRGFMEERVAVRSVKYPIGSGMEVTMIGTNINKEIDRKRDLGFMKKKTGGKSKWLVKVDQESGEEHFFRIMP